MLTPTADDAAQALFTHEPSSNPQPPQQQGDAGSTPHELPAPEQQGRSKADRRGSTLHGFHDDDVATREGPGRATRMGVRKKPEAEPGEG